MKFIGERLLPLADIVIGDRIRAVDMDHAAVIAETVRVSGLQHPIRVIALGESLHLVAGAHRMAAFRLLGRAEIPARVFEPETDDLAAEIRLDEITENLGRHDLNALDRAGHCVEFKLRILKMFPELGHGGNRKSLKYKQKIKSESFTLDPEPEFVAEQPLLEMNVSPLTLEAAVLSRTGFSQDTFSAAIRLWYGLSKEARAAVRGTWLAKNQAQLSALSKRPKAQQLDLIKLCVATREDGTPLKRTVAAGLSILVNYVDPNTPEEKAYFKLNSAFHLAPLGVRKGFIAYLVKLGCIRADGTYTDKPWKLPKEGRADA